MRSLKFRVWDGREIKPAFDLTQNPKYWWEEMKDFPLMQFTGLKDRNGVEIYENDIITYCIEEFPGGHYRERLETRKVAFSDGCYWLVSDKGDDPLYAVHASDDELEVIGNSFTNPELLDVPE